VAIFTVAFAGAAWGERFAARAPIARLAGGFARARGYPVETGWYLPSARFHGGLYGRCEIAMCDPVSSSRRRIGLGSVRVSSSRTALLALLYYHDEGRKGLSLSLSLSLFLSCGIGLAYLAAVCKLALTHPHPRGERGGLKTPRRPRQLYGGPELAVKMTINSRVGVTVLPTGVPYGR